MLSALLLALAPQATRLSVGSPAPALVAETWLKGSALTLGGGKIVLLDFWALGNEQCRASQPYLSALAGEYASKGVTVVGVIGPDERATLEKTQQYLAEHATTLTYSVAWDGARRSHAAFLETSGQRTLPCSFVIDGKGTVAYVGNPMFAVEALAGLTAGTWDLARDPAALAADEGELLTMYALGSSDPAGTLVRLAAFEQKRPRLVALSEPLRFELALSAGDFELASKSGARLVERATTIGDADALRALAWRLVDPEKPLARRDLELAQRAGEAAVALTSSKDYRALETLAHVCQRRGDKARAHELLLQAVPLAPPLAKATLLETLEAFAQE